MNLPVPGATGPDVGGCAGPDGPPRRLRWSARWLVATAAILLGIGWSLPTVAICQVAPLDDVYECYSGPSGVCCVVAFDTVEGRCVGAYCLNYDVCEWEVFIPIGCRGH